MGTTDVGVQSAFVNMRWEFHKATEFERFSHDWDAINEVASRIPALTAVFVALLLKEFGTGRELLAVGYRGNTVHAMTVLQSKYGAFWDTFQPAQAPLGVWVHRPPHTLESLVPGLLRDLPGFALAIAITGQDPALVRRPEDRGTLATLDYIRASRITLSGSFDEYWSARSKVVRSIVKQQRSLLEKAGTVLRLDTITDPADVKMALDDYGRLERPGSKRARGTPLHPGHPQGRAYRALMEEFCGRGMGRIYRYWYGKTVAAIDLCIASEDVLTIINTTCDEAIRDSYPTSLMRQEYFRNIFGEGRIKHVDFYGKFMDGSIKWGDEIRTLYHANYYRWTSLSKAHRMLGRPAVRSTTPAEPASPIVASPPATVAPKSKQVAYEWRFVPATEFSKHMQAWQSVVSQSAHPPVLEPAFVNALVNVFGHGNEVLAICGEPRVPYAMGILTRNRFGVWETFQPSQGPLSAWVFRHDVSYEDIMPSLIRALPGMAFLVGVTQKDPDIHARPQDSARLRMLDYVQTARIVLNRPYEEYWRTRDKKIRYEIGRRLKRLSEQGIQPRLEVVSNPGDVAAAIETYGRIEALGWKGEAGTAVRSDNRQGLFYRTVLSEYCAQGKGRIYRYCFGDQVVAMQLCIANADSLVFLKTSYLENYRAYSPGILMKHAIFEQVFREGKLRTIEFYGALLDWQSKWCDQVRTLYHVNYYRCGWLPELMEIYSALRHRPNSVAPPNETEHAGRRADGDGHIALHGRTHTVTKYQDLSALPARYEPLFSVAGKTSLFHSLPWYRNFVQTVLAPNERLRIYAVDTATNPAAARAALLMRHADARAGLFGARTLSGFSNYYASLFGPVIEPGGNEMQSVLNALAAAIASDEIRWDVIDLHPLAVDPYVFPGLVAAFRNAGLLVQTYFCFGNWYLQVNGQTFKEYFNTRTSRLSKSGRRYRRNLETSGRFRFELFTDAQGLERGLADYDAVYKSSWKVPEPYPNFIGGLMRTCAEQGWLRLGVAYLDGTPAAAQIWIVVDGKASIYKMAYDERFAKDSVGTVLSSLLMEHVIDIDKVHEVDYLTGDDAYKRDWMSDRRERWGIVVFNLRSPKGLLAALRHLGGRATKQVLNSARDLVRARPSRVPQGEHAPS